MSDLENKQADALTKISKDRSRTNILKKYEQNTIAYLVQRIPRCITSDGLTTIGLFGSVMTMASFILAVYFGRIWLLLGVLGFAVNWFGDSLDGRIAYYRNTPRKWYGFSLDLSVDWITDILIGLGFMIYVGGIGVYIGFGFVVLYGWAILIAMLRYKIVNKYTIDSGLLGPTEVRVIISAMLVLEIFVPGSIVYCGILICLVLLFTDIKDFRNVLKMADLRDKQEKEESR
jgi:hypothetical protein